MAPIRFQTTVDDALAGAAPPLRPLLGRRIEMTAVEADTNTNAAAAPDDQLTVDELLARRIDAPPGQRALTQEDIDRAIVTGALDGNV